MKAETLARIKEECEKIERDPGFGKVVLTVEHGVVTFIRPTPIIMLPKLDKVKK